MPICVMYAGSHLTLKETLTDTIGIKFNDIVVYVLVPFVASAVEKK